MQWPWLGVVMQKNANRRISLGVAAAIAASLTLSSAAYAASLATAPAAPTGLAGVPGNTAVSLTWTAPSDGGSSIIGYNVYEGTTAGGESTTQVNGNVLIAGTSASATGLTNGTRYFFTVKAVNAYGLSGASNEASAVPATVPGAPTGLSATGSGTTVSLTWTPPSDGGATILGYNLYQGTTAGGESKTAVNGSARITTTSYSVTGLTRGTPYFFTVKAVNAYGSSGASNEASATPVDTVPDAPTGVTATPSVHSVALAWTAPFDGGSPITGYNVFEGTTSGGESSTAVNGSVLIVVTNTVVTELTTGTPYYFTVEAVNSLGSSPASSEASATPSDPPGAPTGLTATPSNTEVTLDWTAPASDGGSAITGYNVFEGTSTGNESTTPVNSTLITDTSYVVTGLVNGTLYYFTVEAVNPAGSSTASGEMAATPNTTVPGAPAGLTATPGDSTAILAWTAPASNGGLAIIGYNLYEGTAPGDESTTPVNGTVRVTGTTASVTGLTNGNLYYFVVKAVNAKGQSSASNEASVTPTNTPPGAPTVLTATPGDTSVSLKWTAPSSDGGSAITGYNVFEGTTSGGESTTPVNDTLVTTTAYSVTGLTDGTLYYFAVQAVNVLGSSDSSNQAWATPMGRSATSLTLSRATLSFGHESVENLSVKVSAQSSGLAPAGSVTIRAAGTALCLIRLSNGKGSCNLASKQLRARGYAITATYNGSKSFERSVSSLKTLTVAMEGSKTVLNVPAAKLSYGREHVELLSVAVSPQYPGSPPAGSVTIKTSRATLCVIRLSSGKGSCRLGAKEVPPGTYKLVATYNGGSNFRDSASTAKTLIVSG